MHVPLYGSEKEEEKENTEKALFVTCILAYIYSMCVSESALCVCLHVQVTHKNNVLICCCSPLSCMFPLKKCSKQRMDGWMGCMVGWLHKLMCPGAEVVWCMQPTDPAEGTIENVLCKFQDLCCCCCYCCCRCYFYHNDIYLHTVLLCCIVHNCRMH